ncbi:MAG TPA: hypothetical protein DCG50_02990 [Elusimicrobia bacterium]|nr:hypothetical protein [Elusimicrobiota bacterium]
MNRLGIFKTFFIAIGAHGELPAIDGNPLNRLGRCAGLWIVFIDIAFGYFKHSGSGNLNVSDDTRGIYILKFTYSGITRRIPEIWRDIPV